MRSVSLFALLSVVACSSTYHPEYHPVSVNNVSQNIAYPAPGSNVDHVYVLPAAPAPVVVAPEAPPPDFFK